MGHIDSTSSANDAEASSRRRRRKWLTAIGVTTLLFAASACSALAGLDADSTCDDFNDASPSEQNEVVIKLSTDAEGGTRNPLRETNALFQISSVCRNGGDQRLGDIPI